MKHTDRILSNVRAGLEAMDSNIEACPSHWFAMLVQAAELKALASDLGIPYTGKAETAKAVLGALRA